MRTPPKLVLVPRTSAEPVAKFVIRLSDEEGPEGALVVQPLTQKELDVARDKLAGGMSEWLSYGELLIDPSLKLSMEAMFVLKHQDKFTADDTLRLLYDSYRVQIRESLPWEER